jgi:hypothetical protein
MGILGWIGAGLLLFLAMLVAYRLKKKINKLIMLEGQVNEIALLRNRGLLSVEDAEMRLAEIHEEV